MKSTYIASIAFAIAMLTCSCASVYIPNAINSPMLEKNGETKISGGMSSSSFDGQISHSLTDNIAIMSNANLAFSFLTLSQTTFIEAGAGYYTKYFDVFTGIGTGKNEATEIKFDGGSVNVSENYFRPFLQLDTWYGGENAQIGFGTRFAWVKFTNHNPIFKNDNSLFIEPAITGKLGGKNIKGILQLGYSLNVIKNNDVLNEPLILLAGLEISFN